MRGHGTRALITAASMMIWAEQVASERDHPDREGEVEKGEEETTGGEEEDERERVEHLSATKRASSCQVAPFIDSYVCSGLWSERLDTIFARTLFPRLLYLYCS